MILQQKAATFIIALITLVGAGVVAEAEASLLQEQDPKKVEILRNHFTMAWIGGGAVLGGYVAVSIRHYLTARESKIASVPGMAHYLAVSVCSSVAVTPYALRRFFTGEPEESFFLAFVIALMAWSTYEILLICIGRLKDAARKRGWLGVRDELLAGKQTVVDLLKPPVTPQAMPRPQDPAGK